ncbi:vegetative cell wall protein gp1-like isoform X3 [Coturnix japonica]|uniref:vegetative cell wall protein gp1-like isoform X2 n=1 Tax=Coturnix japonica TaxID=93934 RepID=UPI0013A5DCC9|nr:vegetative cell wall protein gp1-like isoform X2 [Coturnix japonica]XP_032302500.1 vegetative cell wall protein gp1-like isoform X3 [Coturnix japonica]
MGHPTCHPIRVLGVPPLLLPPGAEPPSPPSPSRSCGSSPSHHPTSSGLSPSLTPQRGPNPGGSSTGEPVTNIPHGDTAVPKCHQVGAPLTQREGTVPISGTGAGIAAHHHLIPSPSPVPTTTPPSLCPRLRVPLSIQAPVQLWVGGLWVVVLIQKVQGVVAGQPPDGEFMGHFGPMLAVAGDALVELGGFGEQVLQ